MRQPAAFTTLLRTHRQPDILGSYYLGRCSLAGGTRLCVKKIANPPKPMVEIARPSWAIVNDSVGRSGSVLINYSEPTEKRANIQTDILYDALTIDARLPNKIKLKKY